MRTITRLLGLVFIVLMSACEDDGGSDSGASGAEVAGTYTLESVMIVKDGKNITEGQSWTGTMVVEEDLDQHQTTCRTGVGCSEASFNLSGSDYIYADGVLTLTIATDESTGTYIWRKL